MLQPINPHALAAHISGHHWIDGQWVAPHSGKTFELIHPATGAIIGHAASGNQADVDAAVRAASRAQKPWASVPPRERGKVLILAAERLEAHTEAIATLMSLETGKALRTESRVEAAAFVDLLRYYGGLSSELKGETIPFKPEVFACTIREPIGVIGAILAWNVPLLLMALKVAPALAAGNTVVVKAAEEAPLSILYVAQLLEDILPKGVLNILSGDGPSCGAPLVEHPGIGKISFTGSVETGKLIYQKAASRLIPVTLELGGKSPMIIMADADLDKAIEGAITGMRFTRQGQSCTAASRIFIHHSLQEAFINGLLKRLETLVIGDPLDEKTDIGTLISRSQYERVLGFIQEAEALEGATVHRANKLPDDPLLKNGFFLQPTLLTGLPLEARAIREEIFGPVSCIIPWADYDAVIEAANNTAYGLAATVWTQNLKTAFDATRRLEAGFVQVNQALVVQPALPFGGYKSSGLGKEASLGAMLEHYTRQKTLLLSLS
jgi:acyl-CoA reductase-like NAD-dependent aldehyde dehydrogenase